MIIDTHVHYNLDPLTQDFEFLWEKAQEHDVQKSIIVGTSVESTTLASKQVQKDKNLFFSAGIHPITVNQKTNLKSIRSDIADLSKFATKKKLVAVGECGLDYYRVSGTQDEVDANITHQKHLFISQIEFALEHKLPVILHIRDKETPEEKTKGNAYWDALEIVEDFEIKNFVLHCVSGPQAYVKKMIKIGGYMGFDGNITYPRATDIRELFQLVPKKRRLLETDAPYLPPQEFRGKVCEPWMITKTAEYITKELDFDAVQCVENTHTLFPL